ncbi:PH domain-containing protein [Leucobacter tenebrionis]|uniref:PH domain-containing protein n=1 Tax=Leucobacter tenebrionis TaxID=2873270 RepID=UPI001CA64FE2|nr:PH domain-containing protein [Leucobacter tenebrionis]QZY51435.1 PH domain-containing protein [Leucobacter tenebrionis]
MTDAHPEDGAPAQVTVPGDSVLPGTADAEGWRRLHPLSPLLRGGLVLLVIAGIVIANFRDRFVELFFADRVWSRDGVEVDLSQEGGDIVDLFEYLVEQGLLLLVLGGVLGVILLIVLFSWIAWRFHTYRIGAEAVEEQSGVLFRKHRRAPLERIQSVNLQRPLLARALGLTKIEVLTGGQGGKVELSYLSHRDAKTVREQILRLATAKRSGATLRLPGEAPAAPEAIVAPAPMGPDGYVFDGSSSGLTARAQDFVDADVDPEALAAQTLVKVPVGRLVGSIALSWEAVITLVIIVGVVVGAAVFEPAVILGVIPLIIVMAGIIFGQFNKGFNFTLSRSADAVRTGAGLTATVTETIPFGRIHAVEARQPLMWRPFGWWKVRITTAGHSVSQGGQNTMQNVVLPVGREEDVLRVIDTLLPGVGDDEHEIAELRNGLSGRAEGYLGAGPRGAAVLLWGRARAGMRIADAGDAEATLRIRRGALTRSFAVMPVVRAQSVQFRRPLLHRFLGLASIQAHTVLGPVRVEMRGIELRAAQRTFDLLAATVLRVQGAESARRGVPEGAPEGSTRPRHGESLEQAAAPVESDRDPRP